MSPHAQFLNCPPAHARPSRSTQEGHSSAITTWATRPCSSLHGKDLALAGEWVPGKVP